MKVLMSQEQKTPSSLDSDSPSRDVVREDLQPQAGTTVLTKDTSAVQFSAGTTVINGGQSVYKAGNDWADVLQEVRC